MNHDFRDAAYFAANIVDAWRSEVPVQKWLYRRAADWLHGHRHFHERGEGDACKLCGLDLRHVIHLRTGGEG